MSPPPAESPASARLRGRALILGATFFWAASATLARFAFRDLHLDPLVAVELRLAIATAVLWLVLRVARPSLLVVARRELGELAVLGLLGVAAMQACYFLSIARLGVSLAILLQYVAPGLLVALDLVRGERVHPATLGAVAASLAGTALLVGGVDLGASPASGWDWAIGALSPFTFAFYIHRSKRVLARLPAPTVLLYTFAVAAAGWALVVPPWAIARAGYGAAEWAVFATLGIFSTLVPFTLFSAGLRRLPSTETGVIATAEPLLVILFAAVVLDEHLRGAQLVGAALVVTAALLAAREKPEVGEAAEVP